MHSIQTKIMALTLAAILVSVLSVGLASIVSITREGERSSAQEMRLLCDNCRYSIDDYLVGIERSVDMVSRYALEELDSVELVRGDVIGVDGRWEDALPPPRETERQLLLDEYLASYAANVESVFRSMANHTDGVVAFYYRINPEITMSSRGFLYSRIANLSFSEVPLTKIENFQPDDVSHVGWYYIPIARGRPTWIEPYENKNLGINMVSFVAPLYKAGTFIGVIGMDINYDTLVSRIKNIRLYETGFAYLVENDGTIVYHPTLARGAQLASCDETLGEAVKRLAWETRSEDPIAYTMDGEEKLMLYDTLSSGLKLVVTAPVREINEGALRLSDITVLAALAIVVVFVGITAAMVNRLTEPLARLTRASEQLAEGNYDVTLDYDGQDEVGILTRSFVKLVEHLKIHISDLNSKAYRDAMTGVRNKGAYELSVRKLDDAIRLAGPEEPTEFAMIMFDCNDLKRINDTYGHEKGDEYLRISCHLICDVFSHSPVFRMGGDEFAVILQGDSYRQRDELTRVFEAWTEKHNEETEEPWRKVNIARGLAVYDPQLDGEAGNVLKRADERMYEDKKRMKAAAR